MERIAFRLLVLLAAFAGPAAAAQEAAGIYDAHQTELAATLELNSDGRFAYYLSYGAVDEVSQGTWRDTEGGLLLDSDPSDAPAFELTGTMPIGTSALVVHLDVPESFPREAFSALVIMADGSAFAADFGPENLTIPLAEGEQVARIMLALPLYEVRSEEFAVEPGQGELSFRFIPNDLGVLALDEAFLPAEEGAYLLERFGRLLKFRRVEP